jgi:hypothetical protein
MQNQEKNRMNKREDNSSGVLGSININTIKIWNFFSIGLFVGILVILRIIQIYTDKIA